MTARGACPDPGSLGRRQKTQRDRVASRRLERDDASLEPHRGARRPLAEDGETFEPRLEQARDTAVASARTRVEIAGLCVGVAGHLCLRREKHALAGRGEVSRFS